MEYKLEVTIGGLCLFVQREDDFAKGLFVLMPSHAGHSPWFKCDGKHIDGGSAGKLFKAPFREVVTLTGSETSGVREPVPDFLLPVSTIKNKPVANRWTEIAVPINPLAARIDFDLGQSVELVRNSQGEVSKG